MGRLQRVLYAGGMYHVTAKGNRDCVIFEDVDDTRAHGQDERIGIKQFYEGQEFLYRLVKLLSLPG